MPLDVSSVYDKINEALAPTYRKLSDVNLSLLGTKTKVLRITRSAKSVLGDVDNTVESSIVSNVKIIYPFNAVEAFATRENDDTMTTGSLDLIDLLPIQMIVQFGGAKVTAPVILNRGDIVIDTVLDEYGNLIPMILQITKPSPSFLGKFLVYRRFDLSLFRGTPEDDIQTEIDSYLASLL